MHTSLKIEMSQVESTYLLFFPPKKRLFFLYIDRILFLLYCCMRLCFCSSYDASVLTGHGKTCISIIKEPWILSIVSFHCLLGKGNIYVPYRETHFYLIVFIGSYFRLMSNSYILPVPVNNGIYSLIPLSTRDDLIIFFMWKEKYYIFYLQSVSCVCILNKTK